MAQSLPLDRLWFQNIFLSRGINPPDVAVETDSAVLMKSLVASSDFVTILPRDLFASEETHAALTQLKTDVPRWTGSVGITRRRRGTLSPASSALVDEIREIVAEGLPRARRAVSKR